MNCVMLHLNVRHPCHCALDAQAFRTYHSPLEQILQHGRGQLTLRAIQS